MIQDSIIADPSLAAEGNRKIDWAAQHCPVLNTIAKEQLADGSLRGRKVSVTVHLEAKTAYLAVLLHEAGAEVTVTGSNPLSTQDSVSAAALVGAGHPGFSQPTTRAMKISKTGFYQQPECGTRTANSRTHL